MSYQAPLPEYYVLLGVPQTATTEEIRTAYKRESLRTHPDRLPNATEAEKRAATAKFQAVADAYYVLSDPVRRREYDVLLRSRPKTSRSSDPRTSENFFTEFANYFTSGSNAKASAAPAEEESMPGTFQYEEGGEGWGDGPQRPDADATFGGVFEELLRPEVDRRSYWAYLGAGGGGILGYIIANIPGALMGMYAGNRLGAIRDAKGKPVAVVFAQLNNNAKAEILKALAVKILGSI
jgi:curved DNA-binding protein CbpA